MSDEQVAHTIAVLEQIHAKLTFLVDGYRTLLEEQRAFFDRPPSLVRKLDAAIMALKKANLNREPHKSP